MTSGTEAVTSSDVPVERDDKRGLPLVSLGCRGDLDGAFAIERRGGVGAAFTVWYAVAEVTPLRPGVDTPAFLWRLDVDEGGWLTSGRVRRALVRTRPGVGLGPGDDAPAQPEQLVGRAAANLMLQGGVGLLWSRADGGYVAFGPGVGPVPRGAAVTAPEARVTAPRRRLADRVATEIALAVSNQVDPPAWALDALVTMPEVSRRGRGGAATWPAARPAPRRAAPPARR